ncbi:HpcH/HpaI aldolase family protein [Spirillospora sp. CA-255316]
MRSGNARPSSSPAAPTRTWKSRTPTPSSGCGRPSGSRQVGLWCSLADAYAAEVVAGAGFDWLLLDTEHSHADVADVLTQLQVLAGYPCAPVVRPPSNDPVVIKRLLDVGAQTLLIPQVESPEQARAAVAATRYPPEGVRGVSALTRATRFGRVPGYATQAHTELCVLVQVESVHALERLEKIATVGSRVRPPLRGTRHHVHRCRRRHRAPRPSCGHARAGLQAACRRSPGVEQ